MGNMNRRSGEDESLSRTVTWFVAIGSAATHGRSEVEPWGILFQLHYGKLGPSDPSDAGCGWTGVEDIGECLET